jgi:hypothetical protein
VIPTAEDIRQSTLFVRTIERANQQLAQRLSAQVEAKHAGVQLAQQLSMQEETKQAGTTRISLAPQEPEWEWSAGGSDDEEAQLEGRLERLREGREARRRRRRGW